MLMREPTAPRIGVGRLSPTRGVRMVGNRGEANPGLVVLVVVLVLALIAALFFWPRGGGEEPDADVDVQVGSASTWIARL